MPREFRVALASDVAAAFARHGVEYLFIGKGGAIVLGFPGTTLDIDVFLERGLDNAAKIMRGLGDLGFQISERLKTDIEQGRDFVQITDGPFDLDLIFAPDGIADFATARARRIMHENLPVASLIDIIASKRASGREKDQLDLPLLEDFKIEYERLHPQRLRSSREIIEQGKNE